VVAQRRARVLTPEQPASLKLRHDQVDEVGEGAGEVGRQDVVAVGRLLDEPFLEDVGDALGGPQSTQWPRAAAVRL